MIKKPSFSKNSTNEIFDGEEELDAWKSVKLSVDKILVKKNTRKKNIEINIFRRQYLTKPIPKQTHDDDSTVKINNNTNIKKTVIPCLGLSAADERKLRKGKFIFNLSLDLHGCRQHQALNLSKEFVNNAYYENKRTLKIVTGKGTRVIYNTVIEWLQSDDARSRIAYITQAPLNMGGSGVIFIRLRKCKLTQ